MWFNNATIYNYQISETEDWETHLATEKLKPCPPHARFIYGWLPVFQENLCFETSSAVLLCLGKEERILPKAVIHKFLTERIQNIETEQGRSLKRTEKNQLAEDIEFELLPKSFCVEKRLFAFIDRHSQRIIINSANNAQATQLLALLRKSIPGIQLESLSLNSNIPAIFAQWINNPAALPPPFQLATDCLLFSPQDEKKKVNCKGYALPAEEIITLMTQGLLPAEISLIWNERIQFTLTQDLSLKKLKCLDYLADDFKEIGDLEEEILQREAEITLLSGEFKSLLNDLLAALPAPIET